VAQEGFDFFACYYNEIRPHQSHGRPPLAIYNERDKASPILEGQTVSPTTKVRRDIVDTTGTVMLRYRSSFHHIGVGRAHKAKRVLMLVADLDVRILDSEGLLLRHLTLGPQRTTNRSAQLASEGSAVPQSLRHHDGRSVEVAGIEPGFSACEPGRGVFPDLGNLGEGQIGAHFERPVVTARDRCFAPESLPPRAVVSVLQV
jgi:hypothetical protein